MGPGDGHSHVRGETMTALGYFDAALPWMQPSGEPQLPRGPSRPASPAQPLVPSGSPVTVRAHDPPPDTPAGDGRARALFDAHYDFVWRSLRGLGVAPGSLDDGAQQVFCLAFRKLDAIQGGSERSFLFRLASGVASNLR